MLKKKRMKYGKSGNLKIPKKERKIYEIEM